MEKVLRQHLKKVKDRNVEKEHIKCDKCDNTYKGNEGLYQHKRSVHEVKWIYCDACEYKTPRLSYLKLHIKSIITKNNYFCDI